ncbi:MAG TPA: ATP-binding cassette domain-containing protein [Actinomycetota bacterium]|nr:ATP-binding cassette domain-containing protein [Actinomycetota bacterium]
MLRDVTVRVRRSSRVAIMGPNGVGKTTLLRVLGSLVSPDEGDVTRTPPSLEVGHLAQEPDARAGETLRSYLSRRTGVGAAAARLDHLERALAADARLVDAYAEALDRFLYLGGDDLDERAAEACARVGLGAHPDATMDDLSGGEAARAALAAIMLTRSDILLLDEPTNDLDLAGLDRLEDFVSTSRAGIAVVSHDRAFLERCVNEVVEIDEGTRRAAHYAGGYARYADARATALRQQRDAHDRFVADRKRLLEQASRQRRWAAAGARRARSGESGERDKHVRASAVAGAEATAGKARAARVKLARRDGRATGAARRVLLRLRARPRGGPGAVG